MFKEDHPVGVTNGREAVSDDEGGTALAQPVDRFLHLGFGFHVECAGRLVEDQDGRILENGAGDGDALALAAREAVTAFADAGIVVFDAALDEVTGCGGFCGAVHVVIGGVFAPEPDVLRNRAVEQA